jgi:hypothetical protein
MQICAIFEHQGPSKGLLRPATKRDILAALLATLRDAHWCAAVGCQPEPGLMLPISIATALGDQPIIAQLTGEECLSSLLLHAISCPHGTDVHRSSTSIAGMSAASCCPSASRPPWGTSPSSRSSLVNSVVLSLPHMFSSP